MHFELLPSWVMPTAIAAAALLLAYVLQKRLHRRRRRVRRAARRRKNIAYHRAWEWVKRQRQPRALQITDERTERKKPPR